MKDDGNATDDFLGPATKKRVELPPKKTYIVRRVKPVMAIGISSPSVITSEIEEIPIECHRMLNEAAYNAVVFYEYIQGAKGIYAECSRILFNVVDVELQRQFSGVSSVLN